MALTADSLLPVADLKTRLNILGYDGSRDNELIQIRNEEYTRTLYKAGLTPTTVEQRSVSQMEAYKVVLADMVKLRLANFSNPKTFLDFRDLLDERLALLFVDDDFNTDSVDVVQPEWGF